MKTSDFECAAVAAERHGIDDDQSWAAALYERVILDGKKEFATEFKIYRGLPGSIADGVVRLYQEGRPDQTQRSRMADFLKEVPNLLDRFRLAKRLNFTAIVDALKEESPIVCEWGEQPSDN
jgi:spatacsin